MWARSDEWQTADGAPRPGVVLEDAGLRVAATSVGPPPDGDGDRAEATEHSAWPEHLVVGTASDVREIAGTPPRREPLTEFVLRSGDLAFQVQASGRNAVDPGTRVAVRGRLSLVADHEWDAFALIDTRGTWRVLDTTVAPDGEVLLDLEPC